MYRIDLIIYRYCQWKLLRIYLLPPIIFMECYRNFMTNSWRFSKILNELWTFPIVRVFPNLYENTPRHRRTRDTSMIREWKGNIYNGILRLMLNRACNLMRHAILQFSSHRFTISEWWMFLTIYKFHFPCWSLFILVCFMKLFRTVGN